MNDQTKYDKLAIRLSQILNLFNSGNSFTMDELVEEFGVSERTIQRDLNERLAFLPIVNNGGRYSMEEYYLGKLSFDDIQNFAALCGISDLYPSLDNKFITDLLNERLNSAFRINTYRYEDISSRRAEFERLSASILKRYIVIFDYTSKRREVKPYKLTNTDGVWYLVGDDAGVLKTFTFAKISNLHFSEESFKRREDFEHQVESSHNKWFSAQETEVVLQIDAEVADYFLSRKILPNQTTIDHTSTHLTLSTMSAYPDDILRTVRYWMPYRDTITRASISKAQIRAKGVSEYRAIDYIMIL